MRKSKFLFITSLVLSLCSFSSCGSGETYKNDLIELFARMQDNNFTINIEGSFVNNEVGDIKRYEFKYTPYSIESTGEFGFAGLAQDDKNHQVFRYNVVDEEIVSSIPLINYSTGLRYDSIYDYEYGISALDLSCLPEEKSADGYYHYEFGNSLKDDKIMMQVLLREGYGGVYPDSLKMKVVSNVLLVEAQLNYYEHLDRADTVTSVVSAIGSTENLKIKKYLEDGKTSKNPLDLNFFKFFNRYLNSTNYTIDMYNGEYKSENRFLTEKCIDDAVYDYPLNGEHFGFMLNQGVVTRFKIDENNKVKIISTPNANSDGEFYTSIYGQIIPYSFADLYYDFMIGYIDEENENIYHITDSQFIYVLGSLCAVDISESYFADEVIIEILDAENNIFKATLEIYDKSTKLDLFTRTCVFYDLNETSIAPVDNYLSLGDDATKQSKDDLEAVLNMFRGHNYSIDSLTSAGMAKIYVTENYFYEELYGNANNNIGFIRIDEKIRQFNIVNGEIILQSMDYTNSVNYPGVGLYFGASSDYGMLSAIDEGLYNLNNYEVTTLSDISYWKMLDEELSLKLYNYLFYGYTGILPYNSGFMVRNAGEDSKLSLIAAFISDDGSSYKGYYNVTYYDFNNTSYKLLDDYLNNL